MVSWYVFLEMSLALYKIIIGLSARTAVASLVLV